LTRLELDRYIDITYNQGRPILGQSGQLEQSEQSATDDNRGPVQADFSG